MHIFQKLSLHTCLKNKEYTLSRFYSKFYTIRFDGITYTQQLRQKQYKTCTKDKEVPHAPNTHNTKNSSSQTWKEKENNRFLHAFGKKKGLYF